MDAYYADIRRLTVSIVETSAALVALAAWAESNGYDAAVEDTADALRRARNDLEAVSAELAEARDLIR